MKLPIFAINKATGKYEVFPFELLDTLSDGSIGLAFYSGRNNYLKVDLFKKYRDYFNTNPLYHNNGAYIGVLEYRLKGQGHDHETATVGL